MWIPVLGGTGQGCGSHLPRKLMSQLSWGGRKNSEGKRLGSLGNMCVTFPASISSNSDISQVSIEGKGESNKTLESLTLFLSELFGFSLLYVCAFNVISKIDPIYIKTKG